jgi:hypothetical protein
MAGLGCGGDVGAKNSRHAAAHPKEHNQGTERRVYGSKVEGEFKVAGQQQ